MFKTKVFATAHAMPTSSDLLLMHSCALGQAHQRETTALGPKNHQRLVGDAE